jgi:hypothetical protein
VGQVARWEQCGFTLFITSSCYLAVYTHMAPTPDFSVCTSALPFQVCHTQTPVWLKPPLGPSVTI